MALAADHHHNHTLNFLSTGYYTKNFSLTESSTVSTLLEAMELGDLAHEKSAAQNKAS